MKKVAYLFLVSLTFLLIQCTSGNEADLKSKQNQETEKETCCEAKSSEKLSESSEITCPKCDFTKEEVLPTDVCVIKYTCSNCNYEMTPKDGDCCVYCTYGTHKCPSKQE